MFRCTNRACRCTFDETSRADAPRCDSGVCDCGAKLEYRPGRIHPLVTVLLLSGSSVLTVWIFLSLFA